MDDESKARDPATHRAWAAGIAGATWREKSRWSQTLGRNVDRIAAGLRPALSGYATGQVPAAEVLAAVRGLREQLALIEGRVLALEEADSLGRAADCRGP
jgi:hypothetical protein